MTNNERNENVQAVVQHLVELNHFNNITSIVILALKDNGDMDTLTTVGPTTPLLLMIGAIDELKYRLLKEHDKLAKPLRPPTNECGND